MWLFKSVVVIISGWAEVITVVSLIISVMSKASVPIMVSTSPVLGVVRSFMVHTSPGFSVMRTFMMCSSPEGIVKRVLVGWFESWVDISNGGFMSLFHGVSFSHGVSEWFLMMLNITSVCSYMFGVVITGELMWMDDKRSLMMFNNSSMWFIKSMMRIFMTTV